MRIELYPDPFSLPAFIDVHVAMTVTEILNHPEIGAPPEFFEFGVIKINGKLLRRELWPHVKVKPDKVLLVELIPVPQGKNALSILATIATIAAVAAIGVFGIPFLGIAAGSFWASVAAAGVGLAGQLLATALSAPPQSGNEANAAQKSIVQAGFSSNAPVLNDVLPVVFGKIGFSPPPLMPPYSQKTQDGSIIIAAIGLQGRNLIENIKINGLDISMFPGIVLETREGSFGDLPLTLITDTVIEEQKNIKLSEFETNPIDYWNARLKNQANPSNSSPYAHSFVTNGQSWKSFKLKFSMPSGSVKTDTAESAMVPVRIAVRKVGDVAWRNMPVVHVTDYKKGSGPVFFEVTLARTKPPPGSMITAASGTYPIFELASKTGIGQSFAYDADPYFEWQGAAPSYVNLLPANFSASINSGFTIQGINQLSTNFAWKLSDNSNIDANSWKFFAANPNNPTFVKFTLPVAKIVRSWEMLLNGSPATFPKEYYWEGSNGGAFTRLDDQNIIDESGLTDILSNVQNPASYFIYRLVILSNNGADLVSIGEIKLYTVPAAPLQVDMSVTTPVATLALRTSDGKPRCNNASLDENGATFYLDPALWPDGQYEISVIRGWAQTYAWFYPQNYGFHGNAELNHASHFVSFANAAGDLTIYETQKFYKTDMFVELIQTQKVGLPFKQEGATLLAFKIPDTQISSVYAEFTRYAPTYDAANGIWTEIETPTKNPAALYRQLLLGGANATPTPGEVIDEDSLAAWYVQCAAKGYQCNAVMQGSRVQEAKQLLASCGYASPYDSATYGVVMDRDTSAELATVAISPLNSRDLGTTIAIAKVPDAIRANFADETDSYTQNSVIVYRAGKDVNTAKLYEEITYNGFTNLAKVTARAQFDLNQAHARQARYSREMGVQGMALKRGMVVKLNDDVLERNQACGWITAVARAGGFITSVTLDNIIPWSKSSEIEGVEDVTALTDILNPVQPMGLCFGHLPDIEYAVSNVTNSNVCTFVTPIADDPLIDLDLQVLCGNMTNTGRRAIVMSVVPNGFETYQVELADEANELFP